MNDIVNNLLNEGFKDVVRTINPFNHLGKMIGKSLRPQIIVNIKAIDDVNRINELKDVLEDIDDKIKEHKEDPEGNFTVSSDDKKDIVRWLKSELYPVVKMKISELEKKKK